MEKLQWLFELLDKVSGPAKTMAGSLGKVDAALKNAQVTASKGIVARITSAGAGVGKAVGGAASAMGSAMSTIAGPTLAVGAAVGGLAALGGKWMVDSAVFKENTLDSLESMLGSKEAAERVFKQATTFAAKTPFATGQVASAFEKLIAAGVKQDDLDKMMTGIGDLSGGNAEKVDRALMAISQIKGKGKLQGEELMQLAEMGLPMGKVFESLAKTMGKTTDEVQKLMSAGKISSDVGIGAIMSTISGTFGGRMEKASNSLAGLWSTLMSAPSDILFSLNLEPMIGPMKGLVKKIIELFAPDAPAGRMLTTVFAKAGEAIGYVAAVISNFDFAHWLERVSTIAGLIWPKIEKFGTALASVFGLTQAGTSLESIFDAIQKRLEGMDPRVFEIMGKAVGYTILAVFKLWEAIIFVGGIIDVLLTKWLDAFAFMSNAYTTVFEGVIAAATWLHDMLTSIFKTIGIDAGRGLLEGLEAMIGPVGMAFAKLGLSGALGIGDPKKDELLAPFTGDGATSPGAAAAKSAAMPNPIQPSQVAAGASAAGGGGPVVHFSGNVIVGDGVKDPAQAREAGKEAGSSFAAQLTSLFRGEAAGAGR